MRKEKIIFKRKMSFQGALAILYSVLLDCEKDQDLDKDSIAIWKANISSCAHHCEINSMIDIPFGIETDGLMLILHVIEILKYGRISLIVNSQQPFNSFSYKISYDIDVLGIVFEDCELVGNKRSVIMSLFNNLQCYNIND